eukprot:TRINITY_DN4298_c0_g1_i2.p1 TRINITY_DN4298_c0_g1~~TRINITY_DN4298_c0_g1_i2.p1  ORF type:complete len:348 (+),score=76.79 TRINITY_DN4298_c0_g1_i2:114-1046(+)
MSALPLPVPELHLEGVNLHVDGDIPEELLSVCSRVSFENHFDDWCFDNTDVLSAHISPRLCCVGTDNSKVQPLSPKSFSIGNGSLSAESTEEELEDSQKCETEDVESLATLDEADVVLEAEAATVAVALLGAQISVPPTRPVPPLSLAAAAMASETAKTVSRRNRSLSLPEACELSSALPGDMLDRQAGVAKFASNPHPSQCHRETFLNIQESLSVCKRNLQDLQFQSMEHSPRTFQAMIGRLGQKLTDLAGEALEKAFDRTVPGAMEVFQETVSTIDLLPDLVKLPQLFEDTFPSSEDARSVASSDTKE